MTTNTNFNQPISNPHLTDSDNYLFTEGEGLICPSCNEVYEMAFSIDFGPDWAGETNVTCKNCKADIRVLRRLRVTYQCYAKNPAKLFTENIDGNLKLALNQLDETEISHQQVSIERAIQHYQRHRHQLSYLEIADFLTNIICIIESWNDKDWGVLRLTSKNICQYLNERGIDLTVDALSLLNFTYKWYHEGSGEFGKFLTRNNMRDHIRPLHKALCEIVNEDRFAAKVIIDQGNFWIKHHRRDKKQPLNIEAIKRLALNNFAFYLDTTASELINQNARLHKIFTSEVSTNEGANNE